MVHDSLNPTVSAAEAEDYARYVSHPHNLPLVVSAETPAAADIEPEYDEYINGSWRHEGLSVTSSSSATAAATTTTTTTTTTTAVSEVAGLGTDADAEIGGDANIKKTAPDHTYNNNNNNTNSNHHHYNGYNNHAPSASLSLSSHHHRRRRRRSLEDEDRALYAETVRIPENPLTVTEEDALKKRYRAYRKWLRGKSLFKQQPLD